MKDTTIKGNGKSSIIRAPSDMPATFEEWRQQLIAGNGYLDVVLNTDTTGANAGCDVVGTPLSKANLLDDTTKAALELDGADPTVNDALYALSQKGSPAECHVYADNGTTVTMTKGDTVLSAVASGGEAVLYPAELGDWSIKYTYGGSQKTKTYTLEVIGIVYVYPFNITGTLEQTDWSEIALCSQFGQAKNYFSVGDQKTVSINGTNYKVQIIGFDHDQLTSGGMAGITFQLVDCLNQTANMNSSNTNAGGWNSSAMRSRMSTYLGQLPAALRNVIKTVNKRTSAGSQSSSIQTTQDKLFLLSEIEIFGATTYSFAGEGTQYEYYAAGNTTIKKVNGSAYDWWGRSPRSGSTSNFCRVDNSGSANDDPASYSNGVSFGFCV